MGAIFPIPYAMAAEFTPGHKRGLMTGILDSFGVYLIHALILAATMSWLIPAMPATWPVVLRVFLAWAFTAGSSALISIAFTQTPVVSRLVGRSQPLPPWLANVPRRAWEHLSIVKSR